MSEGSRASFSVCSLQSPKLIGDRELCADIMLVALALSLSQAVEPGALGPRVVSSMNREAMLREHARHHTQLVAGNSSVHARFFAGLRARPLIELSQLAMMQRAVGRDNTSISGGRLVHIDRRPADGVARPTADWPGAQGAFPLFAFNPAVAGGSHMFVKLTAKPRCALNSGRVHAPSYRSAPSAEYGCRSARSTMWLAGRNLSGWHPRTVFDGMEDARVVQLGSRLHVLFSRKRRYNASGKCKTHDQTMWIGTIDLPGGAYREVRVRGVGVKLAKTEKSWMPFVWNSTLYASQWLCPHRVLRCDPESGVCQSAYMSTAVGCNKNLRGGSALVHLGSSLVGVAHESSISTAAPASSETSARIVSTCTIWFGLRPRHRLRSSMCPRISHFPGCSTRMQTMCSLLQALQSRTHARTSRMASQTAQRWRLALLEQICSALSQNMPRARGKLATVLPGVHTHTRSQDESSYRIGRDRQYG